jgi:hypothetical protein
VSTVRDTPSGRTRHAPRCWPTDLHVRRRSGRLLDDDSHCLGGPVQPGQVEPSMRHALIVSGPSLAGAGRPVDGGRS